LSSSGLYHAVGVSDSIGFVAGSVTGQGAGAVPTLVETPEYPLVSIAEPAARTFALAAPLGAVMVSVLEIGGSGGANAARG
jgi:hypothetical protein